MHEIIEDSKEENYSVRNIKLNTLLNNHKIELDSALLYVISAPISVQARINHEGADAFPLNRFKLIKAKENSVIKRIFISTTETSTSDLQIVMSDKELFGQIGVDQNVILVDSDAVEYDARLKKSVKGITLNESIRDINLKTGFNIDFSIYNKAVIILTNTLNQICTVKIRGSVDGSVFEQLGSDFVLDATTGVDIATLTDAYDSIRVTAQCSVAPASGTILVKHNFKT